MDSNPVSTTEMPAKPRPPWDKRAWIVGGMCGVLLSILTVPATLSPSNYLGYDAQVLLTASFVGALVILPAVLAGIAKRRWLLWPFYTPLIWFAITTGIFLAIDLFNPTLARETGDDTALGGTNELITIAIVGLSPVFSALPVITIRWIVANRKRAAERFIVANETVPDVDGVWPPRPRNFE